MAKWWVHAGGDEQLGPFTAGQLKRMVEEGKVQPDTYVCTEGAEEWIPASRVKGLFSDGSRSAQQPPQPTTPETADAADVFEPVDTGPKVRAAPRPATEAEHPLDHLLPMARGLLSESQFAAINQAVGVVGRYAQWFALGVVVVFNVLLGVKADSLQMIVIGMVAAIGLLVLQYWSQRTSSAIEQSITSTPVTLGSTAVVDGLAVSSLVAGAILPIWLVVTAVQAKDGIVEMLIVAVGVLITLGYVAALALHPRLMNVQFEKTSSAGDEAIGVVGFVLRLVFRFVPMAYAVGMTFLPLALIKAMIGLFGDGVGGAALAGTLIQTWLFQVAALPLLAYLLYIFYSLTIDLVRATLAVPRKLDEVREAIEK